MSHCPPSTHTHTHTHTRTHAHARIHWSNCHLQSLQGSESMTRLKTFRAGWQAFPTYSLVSSLLFLPSCKVLYSIMLQTRVSLWLPSSTQNSFSMAVFGNTKIPVVYLMLYNHTHTHTHTVATYSHTNTAASTKDWFRNLSGRRRGGGRDWARAISRESHLSYTYKAPSRTKVILTLITETMLKAAINL